MHLQPNEKSNSGPEKDGGDTVIANKDVMDGEPSAGMQIFQSIQSNENLVDSTAGSCDPLFANQCSDEQKSGKIKLINKKKT